MALLGVEIILVPMYFERINDTFHLNNYTEIAPPSRPRTPGIRPRVLTIENDLWRILVLLIESGKIIIECLRCPVVASADMAAL
jgi:hypothetical protein